MLSVLRAVSGLIALAILTVVWRIRFLYRKRLRHRRDREEQDLRSRGFDTEGIRQIRQLRGDTSVLSTGDTVSLVLLIVSFIAAVRFPITGPCFVVTVAAVVIRGAVRNAKRQKSSGADRSS